METRSEHHDGSDGADDPLGYDPAEGLALLDSSGDASALAQQLDFGPIWYVVVLGATPAALTTWFFGGLGLLGGVIGLSAIAAIIATFLHDRRRRGVSLGFVVPHEKLSLIHI